MSGRPLTHLPAAPVPHLAVPSAAFQPRAFEEAEPAQAEGRAWPVEPSSASSSTTPPPGPPAVGHSFSNVAIYAGGPLPVQTQLTIGQPNDPYEQEADRVADQVLRMADPPLPVQRQDVEEDGGPDILRSPDPAQPTAPQPNLENRLNASRSGGSPLPNEVRQFMEPRFGFDFSKVKVHNDADAVQMNRELGAQAFAHGNHIYYGAGKAPANDHLTGHELTHVVQQIAQTPKVLNLQRDCAESPVADVEQILRLPYHEDFDIFYRSIEPLIGRHVLFRSDEGRRVRELTSRSLQNIHNSTNILSGYITIAFTLLRCPETRRVEEIQFREITDGNIQTTSPRSIEESQSTNSDPALDLDLIPEPDLSGSERQLVDETDISTTTTATTTGSASAGDCATVYIWLPSGNNVGHSSIDLAGTYASFWPNQDSYGKVDAILDALNPFGGTESTQAASYAQDVQWEGGTASHTIQLCCLDIAAMRSHWSQIRSEDYEAAGNNCSTIVGRLINAGLQQADCDVMEDPVGECLGAGGEISGIDRPETLLPAVQCLEQRGCDNNWQCDPAPDYSTFPS